MPIIQGTDGDDVLYGDGKSQINGGKGNDTIYPYGGVNQEVILEPGNEIYDFRNGNGPQILVPSNDPTAGRDTYINLTEQAWSINGRTVPARTIFDPYGGVDKVINSTRPSIVFMSIWGSDRGEFIWSDKHATLNITGSNFGLDTKLGGGDIHFWNWSGQDKISIPGSSGAIKVRDSVLTYDSNSFWIFENGEFKIQGSIQDERFQFNEDQNSSVTISGGGGSDTFVVTGPRTVTILDFFTDDKIEINQWFITGYDEILANKLRGL